MLRIEYPGDGVAYHFLAACHRSVSGSFECSDGCRNKGHWVGCPRQGLGRVGLVLAWWRLQWIEGMVGGSHSVHFAVKIPVLDKVIWAVDGGRQGKGTEVIKGMVGNQCEGWENIDQSGKLCQ